MSPSDTNRPDIGPYTLVDEIGAGGMGTVYRAVHRHMQRTVAIKVLTRSKRTSEEARTRFLREARASAQLNHPNIVTAYDVGEEQGVAYLVMEYVDGTSLRERISRQGRLSPPAAVDIARQVALALEHARKRGIVHRDIKPSNILIDKRGAVKVLDMGLARIEHAATTVADSTTLTREGAVMGTIDYLAPEQAMDSHTADTRADIYSLGCTLYHMVTGQIPFPGNTGPEKLLKHQTRAPEPMTRVAPDVPGDLADIVTRMMAKRPDDRYQTPAQVAEALDAFLTRKTGPAPVVPEPSPAATPTELAAPVGPTGSGWLVLVAIVPGLIVAGALATVLAIVLGGRSSPIGSTPEDPPPVVEPARPGPEPTPAPAGASPVARHAPRPDGPRPDDRAAAPPPKPGRASPPPADSSDVALTMAIRLPRQAQEAPFPAQPTLATPPGGAPAYGFVYLGRGLVDAAASIESRFEVELYTVPDGARLELHDPAGENVSGVTHMTWRLDCRSDHDRSLCVSLARAPGSPKPQPLLRVRLKGTTLKGRLADGFKGLGMAPGLIALLSAHHVAVCDAAKRVHARVLLRTKPEPVTVDVRREAPCARIPAKVFRYPRVFDLTMTARPAPGYRATFSRIAAKALRRRAEQLRFTEVLAGRAPAGSPPVWVRVERTRADKETHPVTVRTNLISDRALRRVEARHRASQLTIKRMLARKTKELADAKQGLQSAETEKKRLEEDQRRQNGYLADRLRYQSSSTSSYIASCRASIKGLKRRIKDVDRKIDNLKEKQAKAEKAVKHLELKQKDHGKAMPDKSAQAQRFKALWKDGVTVTFRDQAGFEVFVLVLK